VAYAPATLAVAQKIVGAERAATEAKQTLCDREHELERAYLAEIHPLFQWTAERLGELLERTAALNDDLAALSDRLALAREGGAVASREGIARAREHQHDRHLPQREPYPPARIDAGDGEARKK